MDVLRSRHFCVAVLLLLAADVAAQAQPPLRPAPSSEYDVKAAFVLNFVRFVDWPARAFATESSPLVICVLEPNPFGNVLDEVVEGEIVAGHPVMVRVTPAPEPLGGCHVVFVPREQAARARSVIGSTTNAPVLTVSEVPMFIEGGGIINLVTTGDRVRFEINAAAAEKKGISISSRLLALAKNVRRQ
jgi:hypothetical protein